MAMREMDDSVRAADVGCALGMACRARARIAVADEAIAKEENSSGKSGKGVKRLNGSGQSNCERERGELLVVLEECGR
jgi:hypothetical protein